MIIANFTNSDDPYNTVTDDVWQYDYGQTLQIEGIRVDDVTELDFAYSKTANSTTTYPVEKISDTVMQVAVPDELLINDDIRKNYNILVWIFVTSGDSGETTHQITIPVKTRPARLKEE